MSKNKLIYIFVCLIVILMPWFWIPDGYVYTSEEPNFVNYDIKLNRASTMWTKDNGFGSPGDPSNQSLLIPNAVLYNAFRGFGLDRSGSQRMFISFTFMSIIVGFGLFSSLFTKSHFIRLLGLFFYIFNFYTVTSLGYTAKVFQLVLMPPLFYIAYKFLKTREYKYILLNYIWVFMFQGVFTNLPTAIVSMMIYVAALIYYLFFDENHNYKQIFVNFFVLIISLIPILIHHFVVYLTVLAVMSEIPSLFSFTAIGAPLNLLIQLRGVWWEKSGHVGIFYFNLWRFYDLLFTVLSTVGAISTVVISCVVLTWGKNFKTRKKSAFWLGFYLFGIGLASGFYFLPGLYQLLIDRVPLMVMFREPWAKFVPYAVFSLSAMTLVLLNEFNESNRKKFLIICAILILHLGIQSYPFISGKIIDSEVAGWKRRLVKIPDYWEEYSKWTEGSQKVVLAIPFGSTAFNSKYNWYPNDIGNTVLPMPCLLAKTNVICPNNTDRYSSILNTFTNNNSFDLLKLGGVDQVLIQDDLVITSNREQFDWQNQGIKEFIDVNTIATFGGKLRIFSVKAEFLRPKVYASQNIIGIDEVSDISKQSISSLGRDGVFVYSVDSLPKIVKTNLPEISFQKHSQTEYEVSIQNISDKFVLVFNEAYNKNWDLLMQGNIISNHITVNGFANGWYVDKELICDEAPCNINLNIQFRPQKYFANTMYINIGLFLVSMLSLLIIYVKKIFSTKK